MTTGFERGCMLVSVKRGVTTVAVVGVLTFGCIALTGCSGAHEVINNGESCTSCHSDSKQTYDVSSPKDAVSSNGTVTVKTSASSVVVCKPVFTAEDGSKFVPEQQTSKTVSGGSVEITLEEGTWVLATVDGSSVKASKLVTVSSSASGPAEVEL